MKAIETSFWMKIRTRFETVLGSSEEVRRDEGD
jgi:hypothetical protein